MPSILLIITGSVAATKSIDLCKLLIKKQILVDIILTQSALKFVKKEGFRNLDIKNIYSDIFNKDLEKKFGHIALSRKNNLVIIYPATANFIAKIASGKANNLASASILAANKKIFIAPAMNSYMWDNELTKNNIKKLESLSYETIYPNKGILACGETGYGRLAEPEDVLQIILKNLTYQKSLKGKNILITAGGTIERIDPVRFISNFSSGKQAVAIAKKLSEYGANVTLIKANTNCHIPNNLHIIEGESANDMYDIINRELKNKNYDIAFCAAAISDYRVKEPQSEKIKKSDNDELIIKLIKNKDILKHIGFSKHRPNILVGFAAETTDFIKNASKKLKEKNCDYIILNDVSNGKVFGKDNNSVTLISNNEQNNISGSKIEVADKIIKKIFYKINLDKS
ncbi:MAG: bifunctional phosphopantothenoylcysteine decarboxylase/phosphopantothenate--cysteine ligase CoaBC [Rickettsiales bacterium]|nr:bifunctional phosphopantothenoylcysteine decarboxylase/phosphopantothenate--cysteine ligase CoaBC [Rickettsiales bacterium]